MRLYAEIYKNIIVDINSIARLVPYIKHNASTLEFKIMVFQDVINEVLYIPFQRIPRDECLSESLVDRNHKKNIEHILGIIESARKTVKKEI